MALTVSGLKRRFCYTKDGTDLKLADPGDEMTPEQVLSFYAGVYPELTSGRIDGPTIEGAKATYRFVTSFGPKG